MSDAPQSTSGLAREIPPPRDDRQPLRTNLLNAMQKSGMSLTPLFPYLHPGAIVPAGSLFIGGPQADHGHFFHSNTVDEIIVAFVARDATLQTGQVYVGGRVHGVNSFLKDEKKEGSFALFSVTQRQVEQGEQVEKFSVLCEQCRAKLFEHEFFAHSPPEAHELDHPFATHGGSFAGVLEYNGDERVRTCQQCGHVNRPFPDDAWGWRRYSTQAALMVEARQVLHEAATPNAGPDTGADAGARA